MKKVLFVAMMAIFCNNAGFAQSTEVSNSNEQTQKELVKERRAARKNATKEINQKVLKDAKKQAKKLAKQGWEAAAGTLPIEKQLTEVYIRTHEYNGNFPKYIVGQSTATSSSAGVAHKQAVTRARVDVASQIKLEIAALTEETTTNTELTAGEVETVSKMVDTNQTLIQQSLGRTEVIMDLIREKDGKYEEQIAVSYDGNMAKDALLKMFDEDSAEIKAKFQDLLNKE